MRPGYSSSVQERVKAYEIQSQVLLHSQPSGKSRTASNGAGVLFDSCSGAGWESSPAYPSRQWLAGRCRLSHQDMISTAIMQVVLRQCKVKPNPSPSYPSRR